MSGMDYDENRDYFVLLEEKIEKLVKYIQSLKEEKKILMDKLETLKGEVDHLREANNQAKKRMVLLLEKIDHLDI